MQALPEKFIERFKRIVPEDSLSASLDNFHVKEKTSIRINTLKCSGKEIRDKLKAADVLLKNVSWYKDAFIINKENDGQETLMGLLDDGCLYRQGLSSMLAALVLDPQPGDRVLDMCAAPGSKATLLAALMENTGELICLENVRKRYYKLKSVLSLLGAELIQCRILDARRYRDIKAFDKILLDAPCSSEGRFKTFHKKSTHYWSVRKIKEMRKKQKGLIANAFRLLNPGGVLIYSTCTFAPEENEEVIHWLLKREGPQASLTDIKIKGVQTYPSILEWEGKAYHQECQKTMRILPSQEMEGFFLAKIIKERK